jgi:GntR family transcriptional regulator
VKSKIAIDPRSTNPIFQQIVQGIEAWIVTGVLKEGNYLPSIRDCAVRHSVNPNTVAKAYQILQAQGWVEPVRGTGLRVRRLSEQKVDGRRDEILDQRVEEVIQLAEKLGVPISQLIERIKARKRGVQ